MSDQAAEIRREIREMDANQAHLDPALYKTMRQSLLDDLAELGASLEEPAPQPRPIRVPMPKPAPTREEPTVRKPTTEIPPAERLQQLQSRLQKNEAAGKGAAASLTRLDIRKHCAAHGLPLPEGCAVRPPQPPKPKAPKQEKAEAKKERQSRNRKALGADPIPAPESRLERPLEAAIDLGRAIERHVSKPTPLSEVASRLRGIRRQVWLLMADLEGLAAGDVHELTPELAVLEQAAHQAHQLALRAAEAA